MLSLRREKIQVAKQSYEILVAFNKVCETNLFQDFDGEVSKFEEEFRNIPVAENGGQVDEVQQTTRNAQMKRNRESVPAY